MDTKPVKSCNRFPISRDPPEGGTLFDEPATTTITLEQFPISRDPPEGGTSCFCVVTQACTAEFPISRDPPEGGTNLSGHANAELDKFPISRDPPEGGTCRLPSWRTIWISSFQFLGIPPKGEHEEMFPVNKAGLFDVSNF